MRTEERGRSDGQTDAACIAGGETKTNECSHATAVIMSEERNVRPADT